MEDDGAVGGDKWLTHVARIFSTPSLRYWSLIRLPLQSEEAANKIKTDELQAWFRRWGSKILVDQDVMASHRKPLARRPDTSKLRSHWLFEGN